MNKAVNRVVIVGGGTAGWLSACVLAARLPQVTVTLIESPDIPTVGVGEGTWPTMRETLASIGIAEHEFLTRCDAAFKQGSRFDGWVTGATDDSYLHPFTLPPQTAMRDLLAAWRTQSPDHSFASAMTAQAAVCAADLAPRQRAMPDYAGALNYGYHLDAGKFAALLAEHACYRLGVTHVSASVVSTERAPDGDIAAVVLGDGRSIAGDLFIDCSGQRGLLIEGHCAAGWVDRSDCSFNDRALAVQVPVQSGSAIAAQTIGTAHAAGWLWDIGLPQRRGIGCVYAARFLSDEAAETVLRDYIGRVLPDADQTTLEPRRIAFRTGHRDRFWIGNCLAIGQAAGFIEPLEASAIVMIELSLRALADSFPADWAVMPIHAARFNELFRYRWDRIVEFLKLHYVLSQRSEPYWQAQRDPASVPQRLQENLALWRSHPPALRDLGHVEEIFPAASQQYVLYGMGFPVPSGLAVPGAEAQARLGEVRDRARALLAALPRHRAYLDSCAAAAAPTTPARRTA